VYCSKTKTANTGDGAKGPIAQKVSEGQGRQVEGERQHVECQHDQAPKSRAACTHSHGHRGKDESEMVSTLIEVGTDTQLKDDLVAFRAKHFSGQPRPDRLFVDPQEALSVEPYVEDDDGLGCYPDGVKRTLTDEQIAIFRHRELTEFIRQHEAEQAAIHIEETDAKFVSGIAAVSAQSNGQEDLPDDTSPVQADSVVSKLRMTGKPPGDVLDPFLDTTQLQQDVSLSQPALTNEVVKPRSAPDRTGKQNPQSSRGSSAVPSTKASGKRRQRQKETPYDQRHKRKWEQYIDGEDPVHGSMTHRRLIRELDEQKAESIEMDY